MIRLRGLSWVVILVGVSVAAEIALRVVMHGASLSPAVFDDMPSEPGYRLAARATTSVRLLGRQTRMTIGGDGWRASNGPQPRLGAKEIHIVGDSQAFGWGLDDDETIAAQLQRALGPEYRVVNAAVPGYGPVEYRQILEQVPERATAIVLQVEENDIWDSYGVFRGARVSCGHLTIGSIGNAALPCFFVDLRIVQLTWSVFNHAFYFHRPTPIGFSGSSQVAASVLAQRTAELLGGTDKAILTVVPWKVRVLPAERVRYFPPPIPNPPELFRDDCQTYSAFSSFPSPRDLYIDGDSHLSVRGAALMAKVIVDCLSARHVL